MITIFDWLGDLIGGIGDAIGSVFSFLGEQISNVIWDTMLQWFYTTIYDAVAQFFTMMGNMGAEIFELDWVRATVELFTLFGWALFAAGTVVAIFDVAIEYQCGRANIKTTAINILKGFFACSLVSVVPVELYREFMTDISDEIDRENQIIEDLLMLVKMDKTAEDQMNIEQVNINGELELILKRLRPIAKRGNVELILESIREVTADVDKVKISLAITNLVENAIKYNRDSGMVRVTLDADHKYFYIKVADTGIGIPEDVLEHIFERFFRVDKARSREVGGTGLGLAIAKNVIQMHHGIIDVESTVGEGTTFSVRIPLNYVPRQEAKP